MTINDTIHKIPSQEDDFKDFIRNCNDVELLTNIIKLIFNDASKNDLFIAFFDTENQLTHQIFEYLNPSLNQFIMLMYANISTLDVFKVKILDRINQDKINYQDLKENLISSYPIEYLENYIKESKYKNIVNFKFNLFKKMVKSSKSIEDIYEFFNNKNIIHHAFRNTSDYQKIYWIEAIYNKFSIQILDYTKENFLQDGMAKFHHLIYLSLFIKIKPENYKGKNEIYNDHVKLKDIILINLLEINKKEVQNASAEDLHVKSHDVIYSVIKECQNPTKDISNLVLYCLRHKNIQIYFSNNMVILRECYEKILLSPIWRPFLTYADLQFLKTILKTYGLDNSVFHKRIESHPEYNQLAKSLLDIIEESDK